MKLKSYIDVIKKNKIYIYICIIFCAAVALVFSLTQATAYNATLVLSVHKVNRQDNKNYQYDNYYAILTSELLGNTIVGWLETPNIIYEIYDRAELTPQPEEIDRLVRQIKAKQISSHSVRVAFDQTDRGRAEKLSGSLVEVVKDKIAEVEITGDNKNAFEIIASSPIISEKKYDPVLITIIGLVSGLLIGIGLSFIFEYFKEPNQ